VKHRQNYEISEADYVNNVLDVALNTYKKCIAIDDTPLVLKRSTVLGLLKATRIAPEEIGLDIALPGTVDQYGGYDPKDYAFLVGQYYIYRRSFLTAENIVRGVLEIRIDLQKRCLGFEEYNNYVSDGGMQDDNLYTGDIHLNTERSLYSLLSMDKGQPRLIMTQGPVCDGKTPAAALDRGGIKFRGALLTYGKGKGVWQPTVSAIAMESLHSREWKQARGRSQTLYPADPDFVLADRELTFAEKFATVMTPLMYNKPSGARP
jgi:hypothetical protein